MLIADALGSHTPSGSSPVCSLLAMNRQTLVILRLLHDLDSTLLEKLVQRKANTSLLDKLIKTTDTTEAQCKSEVASITSVKRCRRLLIILSSILRRVLRAPPQQNLEKVQIVLFNGILEQVSSLGVLPFACKGMRIQANYCRVRPIGLDLRNRTTPVKEGQWCSRAPNLGCDLADVFDGELIINNFSENLDVVFILTRLAGLAGFVVRILLHRVPLITILVLGLKLGLGDLQDALCAVNVAT